VTVGHGGVPALSREEEDEAEALGMGVSSLREGGHGAGRARCAGHVGQEKK
jgi:hypothetical protein